MAQERGTLAENERKLRSREAAVKERELAARRRLEAKLDDQLREARKEIDAIIEGLKAKATVLRDKSGHRSAPAISTGEAGAARADARAALDTALAKVKDGAGALPAAPEPAAPAGEHRGRLAGGGGPVRARGRGARAPRQARGRGHERQAAARAARPICASSAGPRAGRASA